MGTAWRSGNQKFKDPLATTARTRAVPLNRPIRTAISARVDASSPMPSASATPTTTGINPWWTYEEGAVPGGGTYMVNVGNGNLLVQGDDVDIPERGIDLAFRRTYNSQSAHDADNTDNSIASSYGDGWTNTFDAHLRFDGAATMSVYDIDGARYDYEADGAGGWIPPPGQHAALNWDGTCGYAWTKKTGTTYYFYSPTLTNSQSCAMISSSLHPQYAGYAGRLYEILGRNKNNFIRFTYAWVNDDASTSANLSEIDATHADGQQLKLTFALFNGHNELASLTRPDGAVVRYSYDSRAQLTDVCGIGNGNTDSSPNATLICGDNVHMHHRYGWSDGASHQMIWADSPKWTMNWGLTGTDGTGGAYLNFAYDASKRVAGLQWIGHANFAPNDGTSALLQPSASSGSQVIGGINFSYSSDGTQLTDTDGHGEIWALDGRWRVTQAQVYTGESNPTYLVTSSLWDADNNLTQTVDTRGYATDYGYDANGNTIAIALPAITTNEGTFRPTSLYSYDRTNNSNNIVAFCDPVHTHALGKDWIANPGTSDSLCPSQLGATRYAWDTSDPAEPFGRLTTTYTPLGYHRSISYASATQGDFGLPTQVQGDEITQKDGTVRTPTQTFSYNAAGQLVSYSKGRGSWTLRYDALNRLIVVTDPDNVSSYSCYYPDNRIRYTESAAQHALDSAPGDCQAISPANSVSFTYDSDENVATETHHHNCVLASDCSAGVIQKFYDGTDRLVEVIEPTNSKAYNGFSPDLYRWLTRYIYDLSENHTVSIQNGPSFYAHGGLYKTQRFLPGSGLTLNNVTFAAETLSGGPLPAGQWTDVGGSAFDALDRKTAEYRYTGSPVASYAYTYDAGAPGLLVSERTPLDDTKNYEYDADGHMTSVTFSIGSGSDSTYTPSRRYTFDADGRVVTAQNVEFGQYAYAYDADGHLTSLTEPAGGSGIPGAVISNSGALSAHSTFTHAYYADGMPSVLQATGGASFSQTYDYSVDGLPVTTAYSVTGASVTRSYTTAGRLLSRTDPAGSDSFSYNTYGQLATATNPSATSNGYQYDVEGEPLQFTRTYPNVSGSSTIKMAYTASGELDFDSDTDGIAYTFFDGAPIALGSYFSLKGNAFYSDSIINTQNLRVNGQALEDSTGKVLQGANYVFDASGRLTRRVTWSPPDLLKIWTAALAAEYSFDAEDHPTYQRNMTGGVGNHGSTAYLYWGPLGRAISGGWSSTSTPTAYRAYHWDGPALLFTSDKSSAVDDIKLGLDGDFLSADSGRSGAIYYDRDQRGRATASHWSGGHSAVCPNAAQFWVGAGFCNFGQSVGQAPSFSTANFGPATTYYRQDAASDGTMILQGVRSYETATGQWTAPDAYSGEVGDPMSQAKYMWNRNNPVEYADPTGYCPGIGLDRGIKVMVCGFISGPDNGTAIQLLAGDKRGFQRNSPHHKADSRIVITIDFSRHSTSFMVAHSHTLDGKDQGVGQTLEESAKWQGSHSVTVHVRAGCGGCSVLGPTLRFTGTFNLRSDGSADAVNVQHTQYPSFEAYEYGGANTTLFQIPASTSFGLWGLYMPLKNEP